MGVSWPLSVGLGSYKFRLWSAPPRWLIIISLATVCRLLSPSTYDSANSRAKLPIMSTSFAPCNIRFSSHSTSSVLMPAAGAVAKTMNRMTSKQSERLKIIFTEAEEEEERGRKPLTEALAAMILNQAIKYNMLSVRSTRDVVTPYCISCYCRWDTWIWKINSRIQSFQTQLENQANEKSKAPPRPTPTKRTKEDSLGCLIYSLSFLNFSLQSLDVYSPSLKIHDHHHVIDRLISVCLPNSLGNVVSVSTKRSQVASLLHNLSPYVSMGNQQDYIGGVPNELIPVPTHPQAEGSQLNRRPQIEHIMWGRRAA